MTEEYRLAMIRARAEIQVRKEIKREESGINKAKEIFKMVFDSNYRPN